VGELGVRIRPVALDVHRKHRADTIGSSRREERDVPTERVAGDRDMLEPELIEHRQEIAFVVRVSVRIAVLAEPVTAEVERDHAQAGEQRYHAKPVRGVAGQAVQQDDGRPLSRLGIGQPLRAAILRPAPSRPS
jgi:hypothetical protein